MKHDGKIHIATGLSAKTKNWKNESILWSELVAKLQHGVKTNETYKQFIAATKEEQGKIKDVGGYVGGYLRNGKRSPQNVVERQLLTLDIDFAYMDLWDDITLLYGSAMVLHATHKHCEASPRFRLVMPLDREVTPDEYVAISRRVAGDIGVELFDNTTFETNRLMFWPSVPKDVEYYCEVQDGPWLNADEVLSQYKDWRDSSLWPTADRTIGELKDRASKQEDPTTKKGIVGAFCRSYSISEAIETFLSEEYSPSGIEDRYTYSRGSTAAGLIVYDDLYAYSHHGTDPISGTLCNAFDLVRVHKFGHLDDNTTQSITARKSYISMEDFARLDDKVKTTLVTEKLETARYDFSEELEPEVVTEDVIEWAKELEVDRKGNYLSTASNISMILANDPRLKNLFKLNEFDQKRYVFGSLPWRRVTKPETIKNVDYAGLRNYIETLYGISSSLKIDDSLALEIEKNAYHPIKEYLNSLEWDGVERLDNLLIEYFGAEDNLYTREAIRKMLTAAVARVFEPGKKFDLVLTLVGAQGTYKSTFIKKLGREWYSDTFLTVSGKEALEQIQGAWLIEMAELAGLRKAEVEAIKHFISKQEDTFRPAYARSTETYFRQCVFFGTTNNKDFLRDPSGNRRFMPIDVNPKLATKSVFNDLTEAEIAQIWAEALYNYKNDEPLYLSTEAEVLARVEQVRHSETDERTGIIEAYLERKFPNDWDELDLLARRMFLDDEIGGGKVSKDVVCVAEIWCECLRKERDSMTRYNTREINDIMRGLENWEPISSTKNFAIYGKQKYYQRIK